MKVVKNPHSNILFLPLEISIGTFDQSLHMKYKAIPLDAC